MTREPRGLFSSAAGFGEIKFKLLARGLPRVNTSPGRRSLPDSRAQLLRLNAEVSRMHDGHTTSLWQGELAISRADARETRFMLAETRRQLEAMQTRNTELEAEYKNRLDAAMTSLSRLRQEVKNPLVSIAGDAELALNKLKGSDNSPHCDARELAPRLEKILDSVDRIVKIVDDENVPLGHG